MNDENQTYFLNTVRDLGVTASGRAFRRFDPRVNNLTQSHNATPLCV